MKRYMMFFKPLYAYMIPTVLANDPDIQNNPAMKKKLSIEEDFAFSGTSTYPVKKINISLSHDEMVQKVVKYICYGIRFRAKDAKLDTEWRGLDKMIPQVNNDLHIQKTFDINIFFYILLMTKKSER